MGLHHETVSFLVFILLGIIYGILFDFFRALRKVKKRKDIIVSIQDIIYFVIIGIILIVFMYLYMKESLRVYLLLSIVLGLIIYVSMVGNIIRDVFVRIIKSYNSLISFIFLPFDVFRQIFAKQIKIFKNIADKCCKKILYVIKSNYCKLLNLKKKFNTKEVESCQEQGCKSKLKLGRKRRLS